MRNSPYNIAHALVVTAVLFTAVLWNGGSAFWRQFLHGLDVSHPPQFYLMMMASSAVMFGLLLLFLWTSTLFARTLDYKRRLEYTGDPEQSIPPDCPAPNRVKALRFTLYATPGMILIALLLCGIGPYIVRLITGTTPADQDLIRILADGSTSITVRVLFSLLILFQAPLIEEALFRGVLFRGLTGSLPAWAAMVVSGLIFAIVHVNAASFLGLWYLGVTFAWLYHRTGTILAPMTAHFLFNATNLLLVAWFRT